MAAMIPLRPVDRRANLIAASIASVPELQKKTRSSPGASAGQAFHQGSALVVVDTSRTGYQLAPARRWRPPPAGGRAPGWPPRARRCSRGIRCPSSSHSDAPCHARSRSAACDTAPEVCWSSIVHEFAHCRFAFIGSPCLRPPGQPRSGSRPRPSAMITRPHPALQRFLRAQHFLLHPPLGAFQGLRQLGWLAGWWISVLSSGKLRIRPGTAVSSSSVLGLQRGGHHGRGPVGIHVERLALLADRQRRDHRQVAACSSRLQQRRR